MRRLLLPAVAAVLAACGSSSPTTPTPPTTGPTIEATTFASGLQVNLGASTRLGTGTYIRDITVGPGRVLPDTGTVALYLLGNIPSGATFDSVSLPSQPRRVAITSLIPGLRDGLAGMRAGGQRQIIVPVSRGFGTTPPNATVPNNAIVIYNVVAPIVDNTPIANALNVNLPGSTITPFGTYFRDLTVGTGPTVSAGQTITFHYTLWNSDGTQLQTLQPPSTPVTFSLTQLITGWQDGVPGMRVGGTRQLIIPPSRAYGANPPQGIPPNAVLVFTVSVTGVTVPAGS